VQQPDEPFSAQALEARELERLGEYVWELVLRQGDHSLPTALEEAPFFPNVWSQAPATFLLLGRGVHEVYVQLGGPRYRPSFPDGRAFWEALTEAIACILSERTNRVTHVDADGYHPEPAPPPRAVPLEYIAQFVLDAASPEGDALPLARQELEARIRFALALDLLCHDAYRLQGELEEQEGLVHRARIAYERAMRIAALKFGTDAIASPTARRTRDIIFWFSSGTRDYMHARSSLAFLLWRKLGDLAGAIAHFQMLLDLDPGDHQGNRRVLLCCLIEHGDDEVLGSALGRHRLFTYTLGGLDDTMTEDTADTWWAYSHACWLFRTSQLPGGGPRSLQKANLALYRAFQENAHVPSLLLGWEQEAVPGASRDRSPGSRGEAAWYVDMIRTGWTQTDGALAWLEELALRAHLLPQMK